MWLEGLAQSWGAPEALAEQEAVLRWGETGLGGLARALYVERGVLHLSVPSPVVAAELRALEGRVIDELRRRAPQSVVRGLRFHVETWPDRKAALEIEPPSREEVRRAARRLPRAIPAPVRRAAAEAWAWAEARDRAILAAGGWRCPRCELALLSEAERCPSCGMERAQARG